MTVFAGDPGPDYQGILPQVPSVPAIPGNPTGVNNVPGGLTGGLDDGKQNMYPMLGPAQLSSGAGSDIGTTNLVPLSTSSTSSSPGAFALGTAQGGTGGIALAPSLSTTSVAPSTATSTAQAGTGTASALGGNSSISNILQGLTDSSGSGLDSNAIGQLLAGILNIPNSTGAGTSTEIPSVSGATPSVPTPASITTPFPANGIDTSGTPTSSLDLGSLLGVKQNTALPSQLDDIFGKGFGTTYANLLQNGGGFNPDINNALINQLRPQETRAFDNIRQTMANAGLSPSGSAFGLAAGDFWSQAANNENSIVANNFNNALNRTYDLFGQGLSAAQLSEANKVGPLQWLSALSPLLGPLISGIASKIPSINISSTTQSQGGTSTSTGTGGTATGTGSGGATTSTNTNIPTATGGSGGSAQGTGTAAGGSSTNTNTNAQTQQQEQHQTQGAQGGSSSTIGFPGGTQVPATPGTTIPIPPTGMPTPTGGTVGSTVGFPGGPQVPATPGQTIPGTPTYPPTDYNGPSNANGGIVPPPGYTHFGPNVDSSGNYVYVDPNSGQVINLGQPPDTTIPTDLTGFGDPNSSDPFGLSGDPFGTGNPFDPGGFNFGSGGGIDWSSLLNDWNNLGSGGGGGGGTSGSTDLGGWGDLMFDEEL